MKLRAPFLCLLVLSAGLSLFGQTSSPLSFLARMDFQVGQDVTAVTAGDLNGDGFSDLASANFTTNDVSVLLNNGDGGFLSQVRYPVAPAPSIIRVGDFDGDKKLDLLVESAISAPNGTATISILLGNGDGTFKPDIQTHVTGQNGGLAIGDFNNDGKIDIAFGSILPQLGTSQISVLLGNGDGTFQTPMTSSSGPTPFSLESTDLNGDGNLDLISEQVTVFLGNGDGTFRPSSTVTSQAVRSSIVLADFNGDGRLDAAVELVEGVAVLLGNGDGSFQSPQTSPFSQLADTTPLVSADFNGDGRADLAAGTTAGSLVVMLGDGSGKFQNVRSSLFPGTLLTTGDFDHDGKVDVASASPGGSELVSVARGKGDGTFQVGTFISIPSSSLGPSGGSRSNVIADFNNDGNLDILQAAQVKEVGFLTIVLGNGNGVFQSPQTVGVVNCFDFCTAATGDLNSDAKQDVLVAAPGETDVFIGNGDGTFLPAVKYFGPLDGGYIAVADFNSDQKLDIAVANASSGGVSILLGNGDGTFGFPSDAALAARATAIQVADFNHDGKPDIAVATGTSVAVLLGHGDGTFASEVDYAAGLGVSSIAVADFNGDGNLDLVTANSFSNDVSVLPGKGDGTFLAARNFPVGIGPTSVAAADLDGDGKPDIATANHDWSDVSVLRSNGDNTFRPAVNFGSGIGHISIGDVNGDGSNDIVVGEGLEISVLLNRPRGAALSISPHSLDFGKQEVGVSSPAETVSLTNTGRSALTIHSISVSGPAATEFQQTNDCGNGIPAASSCSASVKLDAASMGRRTANLTISDSGTGAPHSVQLTGIAVSLGLGVSSGSPSSASVHAGGTATYSMTIGGGGVGGIVTLGCSGAPASVTCSLPSSINVSATDASTFNVTATTTPRTMARAFPAGFNVQWFFIGVLAWLMLPSKRRSRRTMVCGFGIAFLCLPICSCGGGGSLPSGGTPAASYTLTVTATSASVAQATHLTLIVQ